MNENEKQFWANVFFRALDHAHGSSVAAIHARPTEGVPSGLDVKAAAEAADAALGRYRRAGSDTSREETKP